MRALALLGGVVLWLGCGQPKPAVDAGPDTSCGLDCAAQTKFGLLVNRCFEYSDTAAAQELPALGMWVRPVVTLEGGLRVLPVEYRQNGQLRMIDSFTFVGGDLQLVRREFLVTRQSVTYKKGAVISGVQWLSPDAVAGGIYETPADAFVVNQAGSGTTTPTNYKVNTVAASTTELRTPFKTYASGLTLVTFETPDHGSDTRRTYVPDVGFVFIASAFSLTGGMSLPLFVQRIRDPGTPDGGAEDCSLGSP
jgi:hypothetical protein